MKTNKKLFIILAVVMILCIQALTAVAYTDEEISGVLQQINTATMENLATILQQNSDILGIDLTTFNSLPDAAKNNVCQIVLQNKYYDVAGFAKGFNQAVVIAQINFCTYWAEMNNIVLSNNDVLQLDLSDYNKLRDTSFVWKILIGKGFNSIDEILTAFDMAVKDVLAQEIHPTAPPNSGGSGGGGSSTHSPGTHVSMPFHMWDIAIGELDKNQTIPQSGTVVQADVYVAINASGVMVFSLNDADNKIVSVGTQQITQGGKYSFSFTVPADPSNYTVRAYLMSNLNDMTPLSYVSKRTLEPITDYVVQSIDGDGNVVCNNGAQIQLSDPSQATCNGKAVLNYDEIRAGNVLSKSAQGTGCTLSKSSYSGYIRIVNVLDGTITADDNVYDADFDAIHANGSLPAAGMTGKLILNSRRVVVAFVQE